MALIGSFSIFDGHIIIESVDEHIDDRRMGHVKPYDGGYVVEMPDHISLDNADVLINKVCRIFNLSKHEVEFVNVCR